MDLDPGRDLGRSDHRPDPVAGRQDRLGDLPIEALVVLGEGRAGGDPAAGLEEGLLGPAVGGPGGDLGRRAGVPRREGAGPLL